MSPAAVLPPDKKKEARRPLSNNVSLPVGLADLVLHRTLGQKAVCVNRGSGAAKKKGRTSRRGQSDREEVTRSGRTLGIGRDFTLAQKG